MGWGRGAAAEKWGLQAKLLMADYSSLMKKCYLCGLNNDKLSC